MAPVKTSASQAQSIILYTVIKRCANIYFSRQCLIKKVIPIYAKIKIPCTSPATNVTQKKIKNFKIKMVCEQYGIP